VKACHHPPVLQQFEDLRALSQSSRSLGLAATDGVHSSAQKPAVIGLGGLQHTYDHRSRGNDKNIPTTYTIIGPTKTV